MAARLQRTAAGTLGRVGRALAWAVLGPVLVGLVVVAAAILYARTDGGRERVRRLALARARVAVPGLEVGRIDGDYLHDPRLVDVTVRDREGRAAVHADAIAARFDLGALLHRTIAVDELRVEGARVLGRAAADGPLNLTELLAPAPPAQAPAPPPTVEGKPWHGRVGRVEVDGVADVELPNGPHVTARDVRLVGAGRADGRAARVRVDLLSIDLEEAGRLALEGGASVAAGPGGASTLADYDLTVKAAALDPAALGVGPSARVTATVTARGRGVPLGPNTQASVTIDVAPSEIAGLSIVGARLAAEATGARWQLAPSEVRGPGLTVSLDGHGEDARVDAEAKVALAGALPPRLAGSGVRGHGVVTAHVTGTIPALALDVTGDVSDVRAAGARVGAATLRAHVEGPPEAPRGSVRLAARAVTLPSGAPRLDTATIAASLERGELRVDARVAGPKARGAVRAHGVATATRADVTIDALAVDFTTTRFHQAVRLQRATRVQVDTGREIRLDRTDVRGTGYLLTGEATFAGTIHMPVEAPRGELDVTLRRASLEGQRPVDANLHLQLAGRRADVKLMADVPDGDASLRIDASLPLVETGRGQPRLARRGPVTLHLDARCVRLQDLPLVDRALARQGITGGVAQLSLDVTGDLAHPDARGHFDLRDVTYRNIRGLGRDSTLKTVPGLGGSLTLDTSRGATHLGGTLVIRGTGVLKLDGRLSLDPGELLAGADPSRAPLRATVDVPTLELASMADFIDELRGTSGQLTAHAEITGTAARPTGTIDARIVNGKADAVAFRELAAHATGDAGRVAATLSVVETVGGSLTGTARLDRAAGDRLSASVVAKNLDLGFARVLVPTLRETAGVAQLSATAAGTLEAPVLHASLDIEKGRLGVIGQPTFRDIRVQAALSPGRADLQRLDARSGDGTLSGTGFVELDGFRVRRAVLTAHAHRFLVAAAGSTGARLDGDLALEAALRQDVLAGQVNVPRAEVWLPKTPSASGGRNLQKIGAHEDVRFVDETARAADARREAAAREAAGRAAARPVAVDVHVRTGPIYVRSKDLDLELESTLQVGRVASGPRAGQTTLSGSIHIRRGRINIQGQRFDFDPGDITFDGGPDLVPALSIRLERQYPDARIIVALEGTPQKPILHLTSEPALYDQAQIVSLILTGQAGGQPSTGKAFDPTAAVATAVLGQLADEIAPQIGLDVLRVESVKEVNDQGEATGDTDTRVEVGKYISDRVYLSYAHVFAASENTNQNEAHVEYRITRRWMLESVFGDAGVGGVDALWTYRY